MGETNTVLKGELKMARDESECQDADDRHDKHSQDNDFGKQEWPSIPDDELPKEYVLSRLTGVRERYHDNWMAQCPAHNDYTPSLSIQETEECNLLMYCHAGCGIDAICEAIGLETCHLFATNFARRLKKGMKFSFRTLRYGRGRVVPMNGVADHTLTYGRGRELPVNGVAEMKSHSELSREHTERTKNLLLLAEKLGVTLKTLKRLDIGWSEKNGGQWVIPEHDNQRQIVGISYRRLNGEKTSASGSIRGLVMPSLLHAKRTLYVCEGMSDTAAFLEAGKFAIGRPSAYPSASVMEWLVKFVNDLPRDSSVIVVGDRDEAGRKGAFALREWLSTHCQRSVRWGLPKQGFKDVREQWQKIGDVRLMLLS